MQEIKQYTKWGDRVFMSVCAYCGKEFKKRSNAQKYCCKKCSQNALKENKCDWIREYRKKYGIKNKWLGIGLIGEHRVKNFEEEYRIIRKEKARLKI